MEIIPSGQEMETYQRIMYCVLQKIKMVLSGSEQTMVSAVIQCPQNVFSSQGCDAVLPIVHKEILPDILFKGEEVRSIAVDGADRKWVATKNGVWLISAEGEKVIYRFTEDK